MRVVVYIFLLWTAWACRQEIIITSTKTFDPPEVPSSFTETHLSGVILDQKYTPIQACLLKTRNAQIASKVDGSFHINKVYLGSLGDVVTASKSGYFDTYIPVYPIPNHRLNIQIQMVPKPNAMIFSPEETIEIPCGADGVIQIPPYSLLSPSGGLVTTEIHVFYHDIKRLCNSICMPINLETSFEKQTRLLPSWLYFLRIEDQWGNKLVLSPQEKITITLPSHVDSSLSVFQYNAPTWQLLSTKLVSTITVSTLPNRLMVGDEYPYILAKGIVLQDSISNRIVQETESKYAMHSLINNHQSVTTLTSTSGQFVLPVQALQPSIIQVSDLCNNILIRRSLPAYNPGAQPHIILPLFGDNIVHKMQLSGFVKNTEGKYLQRGIAEVTLDNGLKYKQSIDSNGHFSLLTETCKAHNFELKLFDTDSMKYRSFNKAVKPSFSFSSVLDKPIEEFVFIQIDSTASYIFDNQDFIINESGNTLRITTDEFGSFGTVDFALNKSSSDISQLSFTSYDRSQFLFDLSEQALQEADVVISLHRDNKSKISGSCNISNIKDIYGKKHHITIRFKCGI